MDYREDASAGAGDEGLEAELPELSAARLGEIEMVLAASRGDVEGVRGALAGGVDVDAVDVDGSTALMAAAFGGHTELAQLLLAQGAAVNVVQDKFRCGRARAGGRGGAGRGGRAVWGPVYTGQARAANGLQAGSLGVWDAALPLRGDSARTLGPASRPALPPQVDATDRRSLWRPRRDGPRAHRMRGEHGVCGCRGEGAGGRWRGGRGAGGGERTGGLGGLPRRTERLS